MSTPPYRKIREYNSAGMPRGLHRYQHCGCFHFLTFSCYRRQPFLERPEAYRIFERVLETVRFRYRLVIAGYVLMPEHVHLLVGGPLRASLSVAIQILKQRTSHQLKGRDDSQFWQRRYYDFNIHNEEKRTEKLRYIHRNPVKRALVARPEDWPWSSYRHYATGQRGTVEIESPWTAFVRGNQLPEDVRFDETAGGGSWSPTLRWKNAKDGAPSILGE